MIFHNLWRLNLSKKFSIERNHTINQLSVALIPQLVIQRLMSNFKEWKSLKINVSFLNVLNISANVRNQFELVYWIPEVHNVSHKQQHVAKSCYLLTSANIYSQQNCCQEETLNVLWYKLYERHMNSQKLQSTFSKFKITMFPNIKSMKTDDFEHLRRHSSH